MEYVSVRNFEKFQHYKDRAPPWIKLYASLLTDYEFARLPEKAKGQLVMLWLVASQHENKIPNDPSWLRRQIGSRGKVQIEMLMERGFLVPFSDEIGFGKREKWPSRYISKTLRASILDKSDHKCATCGTTERLEIDHIKPVSKGGKSEESNLQVLCSSCNRRKRAKLTAERVATQTRSPEKRREETETQAETESETEGARGDDSWMNDGIDESEEARLIQAWPTIQAEAGLPGHTIPDMSRDDKHKPNGQGFRQLKETVAWAAKAHGGYAALRALLVERVRESAAGTRQVFSLKNLLGDAKAMGGNSKHQARDFDKVDYSVPEDLK